MTSKCQFKNRPDATKPVFGFPTKATLNPVSSASEPSLKIEISPVASLYVIHSKKQITKALMHGCESWPVPLLFANPKDRVSRIEA